MNNIKYADFWVRVGASIIDTLLMLIILGPVLTMIYGQEYWLGESVVHGAWDILLNYALPAVAMILFWVYKSATPGKMLFKLVIVDSNTGAKATTGQLIGRYFAYYVSAIPLLLGFIWVSFDKKKQGWHDKLAGTVVVVRNKACEQDQLEV
ncbi:MAG: putative RDD family membrane protein YckC [Pseudohongiellaceae bacterium]|jgi:uncharacterized RDD family membrane protein YckC